MDKELKKIFPKAQDFLPINGTDYVEFYVGNSKQASHFYKTDEVKNVYNRIIIYDASTYHTQTSCYTNGDFRLTQPVFMTCGSSIESRPPWLKGIGSPACML